jgi:hypothetical protein
MSPNGNNPNDGGEHPPDTRPFLCIPYWTAPITADPKWDTGQDRPLPSEVVSYACESIHTSAYTPGQPLDVTVDVRNSGGGNSAAIATVAVYWADPTVGFAKPTFFAASAVAVPPSRNAARSVSTPTMRATIPATAPVHICLVVAVSHPQDRAPTACAPSDRHWAQRNLQAVPVAVGAPAIIPVMAANPFGAGQSFELQIGPVDERRALLVAREFQTQPSGVEARMRLLDAQGAPVSDEGQRIRTSIELGPLDQRQFQLLIEIDSDVPKGHSAAVEAELFDQTEERRLVGSLGVVLLGPEPD